jgi:hypothetical protein
MRDLIHIMPVEVFEFGTRNWIMALRAGPTSDALVSTFIYELAANRNQRSALHGTHDRLRSLSRALTAAT